MILNIKQALQYATIKLVKPFVPHDKRIGISNVENVINDNFTLHCKWTIIRDLDGFCLDKFLNYHSTVIDMDEYEPSKDLYIRTTVQQAINKGLWVCFSFKEKLCTIHDLLIKNVLPSDLMDPGRAFDEFSLKHIFRSNSNRIKRENTKEEDSFPENVIKIPIIRKETIKYSEIDKNDNFRIVFVSQKLEYPKVMLDTCILVSIDEIKMKQEEERIKLKWFKGRRQKQSTELQNDIQFVEACFEGDIDKVKEMMQEHPVGANSRDLHDNTALMEASLKGHTEICRTLLDHQNINININAVNEEDRSALHKAAYNGNPEIIEMLLKNGADPRMVDSSGNRAIDYAESYECKHIIIQWRTEWTDDINKHR